MGRLELLDELRKELRKLVKKEVHERLHSKGMADRCERAEHTHCECACGGKLHGRKGRS